MPELQLVAMVKVVCKALENAGVLVDPLFTPELVENIGALFKRGRDTGEKQGIWDQIRQEGICLLYTSPSPRDRG